MMLMAKAAAVALAVVAVLATGMVEASGQMVLKQGFSADSCMAAAPAGLRAPRPNC